MSIEATSLPGVLVFTPRVFKDTRGFTCESYNRDIWRAAGIETTFVQDNHSHSVRHTIRALHFQLPPAAQVKLLRVVRGAVWDVAVDIRKGSPTFGQWVGVELSEDNFKQLYIPEGFAHGFCVLSDTADVLYKVSHVYAPTLEKGIRWSDPEIGVPWPTDEPLLSDRDARAQLLRDYLEGTPFIYSG
jgi:dTDP-4-dehydrorhamnose 3,5-epimerase